MNNPYEPPRSAPIVPVAQGGERLHTVICVVIAALCTLHVWSVLLPALNLVMHLGEPVGPILLKIWRPVLLFLAAILLLFQRKAAIAGFLVYVVAGLVFPIGPLRGFLLLNLLLVCGFLAYAVYLYKRGRLR